MDEGAGVGPQPWLLQALAGAAAAAREAAAAPLLSLSTAEKAAVLDELAALERAGQAARLAVLRSLDGEDLAEVGATSTGGC